MTPFCTGFISINYFIVYLILFFDQCSFIIIMSLDQDTAVFRSSVIRKQSISYNYSIILQASQYYGLAEISFYIDSLDFSTLPLDFRGHNIQEVIVNSVVILPNIIDSQMILPKICLQKGRNKVSVMYTNLYNNDKSGCISYTDQGWQLIYTDFEPYGANRVFPCFDQPNLKARFKLSVVTPNNWSVNSCEPQLTSTAFHPQTFTKLTNFTHKASESMLPEFLSKVEANTKMTHFDYTQLIPTYIFCFTAGNYSKIPATTGSVPMTLFIAPSMLGQLKFYSNFIFDVTQRTMNFFQKFFGRKFPFKKLDQVWVRDLKFLGMENAGIVTYNESSLAYNPTKIDYYSLAEVVAHELVHHWFGNFVTMEWWDDIWLNQSFANFFSALSLEEVNGQLQKPVQDPILSFRETKIKGYQEDEGEKGTHAIRGEVKNTVVAQSIFDGIIYGKGAAVMKQLYYLLGKDNFSAALKNYFSRLAWDNATIDDLMADMQPYFPSEVPVTEWKTNWLEQPSLNTFESMWDADDMSTEATITLIQSPYSATFPWFRHHKIQIVLIGSDGSIVDTKEVIVPAQPKTTVSYDGSKNIKAIFLNSGDQSFLQNYIDPVSFNFFRNKIPSIKSSTLMGLIWLNMSQMVKNNLVLIEDYVSFVVDYLLQVDFTLDILVDRILKELLECLKYRILTSYTSLLIDSLFNKIYLAIGETILDQKDRLHILGTHYFNYATSEDHFAKLVLWLKGLDVGLVGKPPNDSLKWSIVKKIFSSQDMSVKEKEAVFALVEMSDQSSRTKDARVVCDVILSTVNSDSLSQLYQSFKVNDLSLRERELRGEGWLNSLTNLFSYYTGSTYFADISELSTVLDSNNFQFFYTYLNPANILKSNSILSLSNKYYQIAQGKLLANPEMVLHVANIRRIEDQLSSYVRSQSFNKNSNKTLTESRSDNRHTYIQNPLYNCHLGFYSGSDSYSGFVELTFTLLSVPTVLPIDFSCKTLLKIIVNGYNLKKVNNNEFLLIPRIYLKQGTNIVAVYYSNTFDNDGLGCISHIDETDNKKQYIYTVFEPNAAHRLIPCFDQPNLKATVTFSIICLIPEWVSASNQPSTAEGVYTQVDYLKDAPTVTNQNLLLQYLSDKDGKYFIFQATEKLPTYTLCVIAGDYTLIQSTPEQRYNGIPMTLYSMNSQSVALASTSTFFFEITKLSLEFYQTTLKVPFPFLKYDSVFCPEFQVEAMENAGLVAFDNNFLNYFKQSTPLEDVIFLATGIAHQCAHHWFGNYVTPFWWGDIWLNEGFADFFGYYCVQSIQSKVTSLPYPSGLGQNLSLGQVELGYLDDQSLTYEIAADVTSTSMAAAFFSGITYQKASTVLKQLKLLMGQTTFFSMLSDYLQSNAWGNTSSFGEFTDIVKKYFNYKSVDCLQWLNQWLYFPWFNVFSVRWNPTDTSSSAVLYIDQSSSPIDTAEGITRYHTVNVAFFKGDGSFTTQLVDVTPSIAASITYDGSQNIKAVLVNCDQQDFSIFTIDAVSLQFFQGNMSKISDSYTRMMVWFYFNRMVRDRLMKVADYTNLAINLLPTETDTTILQFVLRFLDQITSRFIQADKSLLLRSALFDFILNQLKSFNGSVKDNQNRVLVLQQLLISFSSTLDHIDTLELWREGKYPGLSNIPISPSQAWKVVEQVYSSERYTIDQKNTIFDNQGGLAPDFDSSLQKNTCLSLIADSNTFEAIYNMFKNNDASITVKSSLSRGWNNPVHQAWLETTYKSAYCTDLAPLSRQLTYGHFKFFYLKLNPIDYNGDQILDTYFQSAYISDYLSMMIEMEGHVLNFTRLFMEQEKRRLSMIFNNK